MAWRPAPTTPLAATVPVWRTADAWLHSLSTTLHTVEGEQARAAAHVRLDTVLDVAAVEARTADSRTGRSVTTSHETVAAWVGCSVATVRRVRALLIVLGYAREVARGRYLTTAERDAAHEAHGGRQIRMASERALIEPRPTTNEHLPRRGQKTPTGHLSRNLPTRTQARAGAASRPSSKNKTPSPRPLLAVQVLAGHLAARLPWLAAGHIGNLCRTLTTLGIDANGWTAQDVLDLLDRRNTERRLYSLPVGSQRAPLALFAHQMRDALADVDETPQARRARIAVEAAQRRDQERAERATHEAAWQAQQHDPAAQSRIAQAKAQLRAHLAQLTTPHTGVFEPSAPVGGPSAWRTQLT